MEELKVPNEDEVTAERIAFLSLCKQLAIPEIDGNWRPATFATDDGLINGNFAGLSEDGRFLRASNLSTPIGQYKKCSLRDTDVLFARFELSEKELFDIKESRTGGSNRLVEDQENCLKEAEEKNTMINEQNDEEDEDDDDDLGAIGFMFDAEIGRSERSFTFPLKNTDQSLEVKMMCIDDDPGAVQSGHYIWPAASALSNHILSSLSDDEVASLGSANVIELGAGCGLSGITMAHLGAKSVCFTDHDPRALDLIRDNLKLQQFDSHNSSNDQVCQLAWGEKYFKQWPNEVREVLNLNDGYDYVLCSDVIYDHGVVEPLLWTIRTLLCPPTESGDSNHHNNRAPEKGHSRAFLCASFTLEAGTNDNLLAICEELNMRCDVVYDNLSTGGCRLQEIRMK
eukprot:CAMPEP_0114352912 /NCGR_PEP_ID=MMETSP0101-20121206/18287_1 /TAXON_ID=38822 ORGANISM="Pteridomonas danica, Strain PT" /NCGR_SAMPLE_ID=MMETSP0101 /ASSEMBLY_ACC=CAM_ASM_000211 /LENGTH=397 /DNA_ID=CAMNT_0001493521 /DNA_START=23 /DNA_END=1216 /DNA_ORIENTATION=+